MYFSRYIRRLGRRRWKKRRSSLFRKREEGTKWKAKGNKGYTREFYIKLRVLFLLLAAVHDHIHPICSTHSLTQYISIPFPDADHHHPLRSPLCCCVYCCTYYCTDLLLSLYFVLISVVHIEYGVCCCAAAAGCSSILLYCHIVISLHTLFQCIVRSSKSWTNVMPLLTYFALLVFGAASTFLL